MPINNRNNIRMANRKHRTRVDSFMDGGELVREIDDIVLPEVGLVQVPVVKGDFTSLPPKVQQFIAKYVSSLNKMLGTYTSFSFALLSCCIDI